MRSVGNILLSVLRYTFTIPSQGISEKNDTQSWVGSGCSEMGMENTHSRLGKRIMCGHLEV